MEKPTAADVQEKFTNAAVKFLQDSERSLPPMVQRTATSTGARISMPLQQAQHDESENPKPSYGFKPEVTVKEEVPELGFESETHVKEELVGSDSRCFESMVPETEISQMPVADSQNTQVKEEEMVIDSEEAEHIPSSEAKKNQKEESELRRNVQRVRLALGVEMPEAYIIRALSVCRNDPFDAFNLLSASRPVSASSTVPTTGSHVKAQVKQEQCEEPEKINVAAGTKPETQVKEEPEIGVSSDIKMEASKMVLDESRNPQMKEDPVKEERAVVPIQVKSEPVVLVDDDVIVKEEVADSAGIPVGIPKKPSIFDEASRMRSTARPNNPAKPSNVKQQAIGKELVCHVAIEDGDFPDDPDWFLLGRTMVTALSTTKGSKLRDNEIVHFAFPSAESISQLYSRAWVKYKTAVAAAEIVRFSTKRFGEIGRLPMEWAKCLIPLVNSSKVRVFGRCVAAPACLHLMQEIMLYLSFYVHHSIFTEGNKSSWNLDTPAYVDPTVNPLPTLFKILSIRPYQKAEFTPEELDSRKRPQNLGEALNDGAPVVPVAKRRKNCQEYPEPVQDKDEQAISESALNKLVGASEVYDLEEMEPPRTLTCQLKPYQKQALFWMSETEECDDAHKPADLLHPCWAAYQILDERAPIIYVNIFSGESTIKRPTATQMARGGILADAMGLGKTVMTIALILARPGRGNPDSEDLITEVVDDRRCSQRSRNVVASPRANGGCLVICPMALLGQWKDELETHSKADSISIFIHYGGCKTRDPWVIARHNVVLTTYGVLSAAYKSDGENSIFHTVDWYRVVLDEAHTIKSSKTQVAQAAFKLSSYSRWCLTGTPLQNNLEDLYSLLCFLRVRPWCNWAWWSKLIQKPYECGDPRGLRLIKAILRSLMLRRTKETKDKAGRAILTLPPVNTHIVECEQSEAEHDFYNALFTRSQLKFEQFVAEGKVLHNYASILELLLRLRQCCNHPFLVMSRGDTRKYTDLDQLARRFLESSSHTVTSSSNVPSRAYVEEVVEEIRRGENTECPICMEFSDDPVLTPCAHRMCKECLLASWRTPSTGDCPICRQELNKSDLISLPTDNHFRFDPEENWKASSKVLKLLEYLEMIRPTGEKTIVFSQWTSFFDLLEIPLRKKRIGFLRFDGQLAQKQREMVLKEFNYTRDKMVMLMSLKAGGVGLNLTAASNVFIVDPWWNPAVEEQAIMRIHRIGQQRTVKVRRFIVKDTVEERMQQVQARKQRMIAGALTDDEVRSSRIEELKMLFR